VCYTNRSSALRGRRIAKGLNIFNGATHSFFLNDAIPSVDPFTTSLVTPSHLNPSHLHLHHRATQVEQGSAGSQTTTFHEHGKERTRLGATLTYGSKSAPSVTTQPHPSPRATHYAPLPSSRVLLKRERGLAVEYGGANFEEIGIGWVNGMSGGEWWMSERKGSFERSSGKPGGEGGGGQPPMTT